MKKNKILFIVTLLCMLGGSFKVFAGEWEDDGKGIKYIDNEGEYINSGWLLDKDGSWYYFKDEYMQKEWILDKGKWYYLAYPNGYLRTNMWIGNYYVGSDGAMLVDTVTPDGYNVGADGAKLDIRDIFKRIPHEYIFASGAGGWGTNLYLRDDGTFSGEYIDENYDIEGYYFGGHKYHVLEEESNFSGRFINPQKINEYTYSFELAELHYNQEVGSREVKDGLLYTYTTAYGIAGGKIFYLYTKEADINSLPQEFMNWMHLWNYKKEGDNKLSVYGIYNLNTKQGFQSF